MPRYFFHVQDVIAHVDTVGALLPSDQSARAEGMILAGEMIRDGGIMGKMNDDWSVQVADETGLILFHMDFAVAETATTGRPAVHQKSLVDAPMNWAHPLPRL